MMRNLMSVLRIVAGVLVSIGYFAGVAYLPRPYSSILVCLSIWLLCGFFFYTAFRALKTGRIGINARIKSVVYERASFEYWFYVVLSSFMGLLTLWLSLSIMFPSKFHMK